MIANGEVDMELMKLQLQSLESMRAYPPRLSLTVHCDMALARRSLTTKVILHGTEPRVEPCLFFALPVAPEGTAWFDLSGYVRNRFVCHT